MSVILNQFLSSSLHIGAVPSGALLLNKNSNYPWFLIVPGGDFVEWVELPAELQTTLSHDINQLSRFLLEDDALKVEKINVASIGNIVPRFHLHIVGRNRRDPAWPGPVWGHPDHRDYVPGEVDGLTDRLARRVEDFQSIS